MADDITISKTYLETLLRRADLHTSEDSVTTPVARYNALIQDATRFYCLKAALIAGGASEETLEVLISSQAPSTFPLQHADEVHSHSCKQGGHSASTPFQNRTKSCDTDSSCHYEEHSLEVGHRRKPALPPTPTSLEHNEELQNTHPLYATTNADRSLILSGVPESSSLSDVTKAVRGGLIFNVFIRHRERLAHVSFVDPKSAMQFYNSSQTNSVYVKGKPVKVFWDTRQAYLTGRVISRVIHNSATRNLVIRFVGPTVTAESIRADLDHIFRLQVIEIHFEGGHAWIQTNSILHAITAQVCLSSQLKYRNLRIEHFPDECDAPLRHEAISGKQRLASKSTPKPAVVPFVNRFQALSADSYDSEDSDDESFLNVQLQ